MEMRPTLQTLGGAKQETDCPGATSQQNSTHAHARDVIAKPRIVDYFCNLLLFYFFQLSLIGYLFDVSSLMEQVLEIKDFKPHGL